MSWLPLSTTESCVTLRSPASGIPSGSRHPLRDLRQLPPHDHIGLPSADASPHCLHRTSPSLSPLPISARSRSSHTAPPLGVFQERGDRQMCLGQSGPSEHLGDSRRGRGYPGLFSSSQLFRTELTASMHCDPCNEEDVQCVHDPIVIDVCCQECRPCQWCPKTSCCTGGQQNIKRIDDTITIGITRNRGQ
jgi:hypothetical protein